MDSTAAPILVVEDEPTLRNLLGTALRALGRPITAVEDGRVAWSALNTSCFALLITDLQMPNMDGPTLLRHFQSLPQRASTPILAISARPRLLHAVGASGLADRTLAKPFSFRALLREAEELLA